MISWKRWLLAALGVLLLAGCVAGTFLLLPEKKEEYISIVLNGEREMKLPVGGDYSEPGAVAFYHKEGQDPIPVEVSVTGSVSRYHVGKSLLTYTARYEKCLGTAYRRVTVADEIPPEITLSGNPENYTLPGHPYEEEGYVATDNYDGDLTEQVVRKDLGDRIEYTVKDSSGNTTTVIRDVLFNDPIAPELKLKGSTYLTIRIGSAFRDPGWEARDNCDGDITAKVKVTGTVNVYAPGTYVLAYTVRDSFGNETRKERTVVVQDRQSGSGSSIPLPDVVAPNGKVIYLTFDDGPSQHTPRLLDVLKKYNVKATFFVVNTYYMSTVKRIAAEGHTVAIHSASHEYKKIYSSEDAYFADLYRMQDIIKSQTGQTATILRFPGGTSNSTSKKYNAGIMTRLSQQVKERGFRYFDWNVASGDTGNAKSASRVFQNVIKGVQKHKYSVVLQHDIKGYSVDAVESIINWGLANGYTFLPLTMDSPVCEHKPTN